MMEIQRFAIWGWVPTLLLLVTTSISIVCLRGVSSFQQNVSELYDLETRGHEVLYPKAYLRTDDRQRRSNVKIVDDNENTPYFINLPYEGDVPINARLGHEVLTVTAIDNDEQGTCSANISYSLQPFNGTLDFTYFTIGKYDGVVSVERRFDDGDSDQHKTVIYKFLVKASDGGCWSKHNETLVMVFVWFQPIFDVPGQFFNMSSSPVEGETKNSWCEDIPRAYLNVPNNGSIKYTIKVGNVDGRFTIDEDTGRICNNVELDREDIEEYYLLISTSIDIVEQTQADLSNAVLPSYCQDLHLSELCVLITVCDINDNIPVFTKPIYTIAIYYDIPLGSNVITVTATDEDRGNYSIVHYEIVENAGPFAIQRWSGNIYTTTLLNADTSTSYVLYVRATDDYGDGHSSLFDCKLEIIPTSMTNAVVMTSFLPVTYLNAHQEDLISDLEEHLQFDVAILDIGVSLSEKREITVDSTDIWFTCTYPQTHDVVQGDYILNTILLDDVKLKWYTNTISLGSTERWKSILSVNDPTTTTWFIVPLVILLVLLLLAVISIIVLILINREIINPPCLKHEVSLKAVICPRCGPKGDDHEMPVISKVGKRVHSRKSVDGQLSKSADDTHQMQLISKPFTFPPAHELKRSDITRITRLGERAFGEVEKATLRNFAGQAGLIEVVVKCIEPEIDSKENRAVFEKALNVLKSLEYHPNIITFIGFVTTQDPIMLVFEFAPEGELLQYLRDRKIRGISKDKLVKFTLDVAKGMVYLSSKQIIHRNLAARNVLVSGDTCKISDFGLSEVNFREIYYFASDKSEIPVLWTAPECLTPYKAKYNTKTDVWSYGVVMWEIMSLGERPYSSGLKDRIKQYLEQGRRLTKPRGCPDNIYEVMNKCWQLNQNDRPTFRRLANEIDAIHCDLTDQDDYDDVEVGAQLPAVDGYDDITVHIP